MIGKTTSKGMKHKFLLDRLRTQTLIIYLNGSLTKSNYIKQIQEEEEDKQIFLCFKLQSRGYMTKKGS